MKEMKCHFCIAIIFLHFLCIQSQSGFSEKETDDVTIEITLRRERTCYLFSNDTCKKNENGYTFRENCIECKCEENGQMTCCNLLLKPVDWQPHCHLVANMATCSYELRRSPSSILKCLIRKSAKAARKIRRTSTVRIMREEE